jgi:HlyD family secretion protein
MVNSLWRCVPAQWCFDSTGADAVVNLRYKISAAVVAALVLVVMFASLVLYGPTVQVESVVQKNFVQTVVATGRVENAHRIDVGVQLTGTVRAVPVSEGQKVMKDTVLLQLDSAELQAALRQAELAEQQARVHVRQIKELQAPMAEQALLIALANRDNTQVNNERTQQLFDKGFLGAAARDEAQRAAHVALAQYKSSRQQLASVRSGGSELASAEAALAFAQAAVDGARSRLSYTFVRAPVSGTLIARHVELGDVVQPGKVLMVLSPAGETQLVLQLDEKNLSLVRVGQLALASADAYAQERFEAAVAYINPGVDAQRGSVDVKLNVPQPPAYLKQDMTVSVDIEVARRAQAVLVSVASVHDLDKAQPWVLRVNQGHAQRQVVTLGLVSNGLCEVLSGLHVGDQVVPLEAATVSEGTRVRAVIAVAGPKP